MKILNNKNSAKCEFEKITFNIEGEVFNYKISEIEKLSILTTDKGPFEDDIAVAVFTSSDIFLIKSEHPQYKVFLLNELTEFFNVDYQAIIDSSVSTDNAEFVIFKKQ